MDMLLDAEQFTSTMSLGPLAKAAWMAKVRDSLKGNVIYQASGRDCTH